MPLSRVALYALSLLSLVLAVRSALGKPLSYSTALVLASIYATLLALGALRPRLQLFADALTSVGSGEFAILVRCTEADVEAWVRALAPKGLVVTFSLREASDETLERVRAFAHGVVNRVDYSSAHARPSRSPDVQWADVETRWHTPWFGRALRRQNLLLVAPRAVVASNRARLSVSPGGIVAVHGPPDPKAIERWCDEIAEARVTAVALR